MLIDAKFGACAKCKKKFEIGEKIEWDRETKISFHLSCVDNRPTLLEILDMNMLADRLGFDDLPGRSKKGYID